MIVALFAIFLTARATPGEKLRGIHLAWLENDDSAVAEVTFPVRVEDDGDRVDHDLHPRKRRASSDDEATVVYRLNNAHGRDLTVHLSPSRSILSPGALVQTIGEGDDVIETETVDYDLMTECQLHGSATSSSNDGGTANWGRAAISVCDGNLTGVIRFVDYDLFIEPVTSERTKSPVGHPHVIFKRSRATTDGTTADSTANGFCHVDHDDAEDNGYGNGDSRLASEKLRRPRRDATAAAAAAAKSYYIKTLIVVDHHAIEKHRKFGDNREKLKNYVLGLVNIAQTLFDHNSTGFKISFPVVRIVFLKKFPRTFQFTNLSVELIRRFCPWQETINVPKNHRKHHDYAVFLTGSDLWSFCQSGEKCTELGRAYLSSFCVKKHSCQVLSESGLRTGFVMGHELGHSFGMYHDGDKRISCPSEGFIMSSFVGGQANVHYWSPCSLRYMKKYMTEARSLECILDPPTRQEATSRPGEMYTLDQQCVFQTGRLHEKLCDRPWAMNVVCQSLWCENNDTWCRTVYVPAADGSYCGPDKVCVKGQCVEEKNSAYYFLPTAPVQGNWGRWASYSQSPCSRSCGGGIQARRRLCNNPNPRNGGKYCTGLSYQIQLCNNIPCSVSGDDWRKEKCSSFRDGKGLPLLNLVTDEETCKLWCYSRNQRKPVVMTDVIDGVTCSRNSSNRCFQGKCQRVGCDDVWQSHFKDDYCGVCDGRGETCDIVTKTVRKKFLPGDCFISDLEPKAKKVRLRETLGRASIVFAIKGATVFNSSHVSDRTPYLEMHIAGSTVEYIQNWNGTQRIVIEEPLENWLRVSVCNPTQSRRLIDAHLRYARSTGAEPPDNWNLRFLYTWKKFQTSCSKTCKGGKRRISYVCYVPAYDLKVEDEYCGDYRNSGKPPESKLVPCNSDVSCSKQLYKPTFMWSPTPWRRCSKSCGIGVQKRSVPCRQLGYLEKNVAKRLCDSDKRRPPFSRSCVVRECPVDGGWSEWKSAVACSKSCGRGVLKMERTCSNPARVGDAKDCVGASVAYSVCNEKPCPTNYTETYTAQCMSKYGPNSQVVYRTNDIQHCRISCQVKNSPQRRIMRASDGTRCRFQSEAFCLRGRCESVNCTGRFTGHFNASLSVPDRCGLCGGNGSTCATASNSYRMKNVLPGSYHVQSVPAGGSRLTVFVAFPTAIQASVGINLKNDRGNVVYSSLPRQLTGQSAIASGFDVELYYRKRNSSLFIISSSGRFIENITIAMTINELMRSSALPRIDVRYFVEKRHDSNVLEKYYWLWSKSGCSVACGEGENVYSPKCANKWTGAIEDTKYCADLERPQNRLHGRCTSPCTTIKLTTKAPVTSEPVSLYYFTRVWEKCSASCGIGVKRRDLLCLMNGEIVSMAHCDGALAKPSQVESCFERRCPRECQNESQRCKNVASHGLCTVFGAGCCSCEKKK